IRSRSILGFASWTTEDLATSTVTEETFDLNTTGKVKVLNDIPLTVKKTNVYSNLDIPVTRVVTTTSLLPAFTRTRTETTFTEFVTTNNEWSYYTRPFLITVKDVETKGGVDQTLLDQTQTLIY